MGWWKSVNHFFIFNYLLIRIIIDLHNECIRIDLLTFAIRFTITTEKRLISVTVRTRRHYTVFASNRAHSPMSDSTFHQHIHAMHAYSMWRVKVFARYTQTDRTTYATCAWEWAKSRQRQSGRPAAMVRTKCKIYQREQYYFCFLREAFFLSQPFVLCARAMRSARSNVKDVNCLVRL